MKNQKIILSSSVLLGLVVALPAFAVMMTGTSVVKNTTTNTGDTTTISAQSAIPISATYQAQPCEFNTPISNGNMMYANPCAKFIQSGRVNFMNYGHKAQWYELMFILTVMMVWAVLLLLIGVLWKQLKKHK